MGSKKSLKGKNYLSSIHLDHLKPTMVFREQQLILDNYRNDLAGVKVRFKKVHSYLVMFHELFK